MDQETRADLEATVAARRELGAAHEQELIDGFMERLERRVGKPDSERALKARREHQRELTLGAMGISVPLFALAAIFVGTAGVIAVCVALAVIAIVAART